METCIDYTDRKIAVISSDEQKWHTRIRKLQNQYPDKVRIKYAPETNDGNMVAEIPTEWVRVKGIGPGPKRAKRDLTAEQRTEIGEHLRKCREKNQDFGE